jgi:vancomycin resistance protein YoaR
VSNRHDRSNRHDFDPPTELLPPVPETPGGAHRASSAAPAPPRRPERAAAPPDARHADPITDPHLPLLSDGRGPLTGSGAAGSGAAAGLGAAAGQGRQAAPGRRRRQSGIGPLGPPGAPYTPDSPDTRDGDHTPDSPDAGDGDHSLEPPRTWKSRLGWHDKRPPKHLLIPAGIVALLLVGYLMDLLVTRGDMPRGTVIAGVDVGGLSKTAAGTKLRAAFEPLKDRPVPVRAGDGPNPVVTNLQPATAGLKVDYRGTLAAADDQPLNPFTRLGSFFDTRERDVVAQDDNGALGDALDAVGALVHRDPTDAGVRFDGITPVPVQAAPGADLDVPAAVAEVRRQWLTGTPIVLPLRATEPTGRVSNAAVQQAIDEIAKPAVSGDVRVTGDGHEALLVATSIASALSFAPDGNGGLKPAVDLPKIEEVLRPQLVVTEKPGKDATVELIGERPEVVPSVDGHGVDYPGTLAGLIEVLKKPAQGSSDARRITAIYADQPAKLTTDQLDHLGVKDVVSTFSTGGFAKESGENIRRAAEAINGKILLPGETFSLNDATGPRDAPQGYVDAGIIQDGHPARGIGGGVSQLATTLYNAAYFAGMTDVRHQEHSYYISRYPQAREATVYEGAIDLKFRNDGATGVFIQTVWTSSSITVKFFGTKHFEVTSAPGEKTDFVPPQAITIPAGQPCNPSAGGQGFTTSDTRTMRNLDTGQVTTSTHRVKYKPSPMIICAGGPMPYPTAGTTSTSASTSSTTGASTGSSSPTTPKPTTATSASSTTPSSAPSR